MQRYRSIDILRGLAIILMIQVHFVDNLSWREKSTGALYDLSVVLGSLPAPFFTFVSGLSYGLWVRKQQSLRREDREITNTTLRRGLFLFALGIVFNFCVWLPEETFNWDILTLIGTSLLFLAFARKLPLPVLTLICVVVFLISPMMRVATDYSAYWANDAYSYDFNFRDIFLGFISNGYFPVFPWIVFPVLGYVCGDLVFRRRPHDVKLWYLAASAMLLIALSGILIAFGKYLPSPIANQFAKGLSEFPASTEYVLAILGFILISLVVLHLWFDREEEPKPDGRVITSLGRFSAFSLTIYVLHHMVILWPLWIYGAVMGQKDITIYWRQAMTTPVALALAGAFLVSCHFVLLFLEKHRKFSLEWLMRRVCD